MTLCVSCQKISTVKVPSVVPGSWDDHLVYTHTRSSLMQASASGCCFCALVHKALATGAYPSDDEVACCIVSTINYEKHIAFRVGTFGDRRDILVFYLEKEEIGTKDLGFRTFSHNTNYIHSWKRVETWYEQCKGHHSTCKASASRDPDSQIWLPTRLLDTGGKYADPSHLRIAETEKFDDAMRKDTSYLVLSHCWGVSDQKPFITLTSENKDRLQEGFSISELPPNFYDAVYTTRRLGFQYIWIDSLCIIQGGDGNWTEESLLMNQVYSNAEICLAAAASNNAYGGFFRQRDPDKFRSIPVKLSLEVVRDGKVCLESTSFCAYLHSEGSAANIWQAVVNHSPLNRRGWVLQERILARCTVYFTQDQICWECKDLQALETIPDHGRKSLYDVTSSRNWGNFNFKDWEPDCDGPELIKAQQVHKIWRGIISSYTQCDPLTEENDKLVAVSGVATAFAKHLGRNYYAGLWGNFLMSDLLWRVAVNKPRATPEIYRAPTWSWASHDGKIEWWRAFYDNGQHWEPLAKVPCNPPEIRAVSSNVMGSVNYAQLSLSGYLVPTVPWHWDRTTFYFMYDDEGASPHEPHILLPLVKEVDKREYEEDAVEDISGLVLKWTSEDCNASVAEYRRLGIFNVRNKASWTEEWLEGRKETEISII